MFTRLLFSGFFQRPTAQAPEPIFTQNTSNDVVPRTDDSNPQFPKTRYFFSLCANNLLFLVFLERAVAAILIIGL